MLLTLRPSVCAREDKFHVLGPGRSLSPQQCRQSLNHHGGRAGALLGAVGGAVDYSLANTERIRTQSVLDSAVLAGVQESTTALRIAKAQAFFDA